MGVHPLNNCTPTPDMLDALMQRERTRKILCKLYRYLADINDNDKIKVVIDCAGHNVRLTRTLHDD